MGKNGKPMDKIDKECGLLRDRFKCLELDVERDLIMHPGGNDALLIEDRCSRWTTFPYFFANGDLYCGTNRNPNYVNGISPKEKCEFAICEITKLFVMRIWKELVSHNGDLRNFIQDRELLYKKCP